MYTTNAARSFGVIIAVLAVTQVRGADEQKSPSNDTQALDWATPVLNAVMCPLTKDPWGCGREQAARMIDVALADVEQTKQAIKDEADADLADRISRRAFSESDLPEKEKPSAVMTTLDNYVTNSILSFMGRTNTQDRRKPHQHGDHQHHQSTQSTQSGSGSSQPDVHVHVHNDNKPPAQDEHHAHHQAHPAHPKPHEEEHEEEEEDDEELEELQVFEGHHNVGSHHGHGVGHRRPHHAGGHRQPIHHKYGRDLGVTRGKKHKKKFKKALVKLLVLAAVAKVKLEFFLKVLGTHLQVKFFIIALLGLLLNAAKFWIDLKKGHSPQKVIYYEHAQHQHHYDDHADDGWGGGGGYWKRSFDNEDSVDTDAAADPAGFEERAAMQAYRQSRTMPSTRGGQLQQRQDAQQLAYSRQRPATV